MYLRFIIPVLFICSIATGCGKSEIPGGQRPVQIAQVPGMAGQPVVGGVGAPQIADRKIIYTADIEIVVDDMNASVKRLTNLVASLRDVGGYLSHQDLTGTGGSHRRGLWTIRVPVSEFDQVVSALEQLGELERNSLNAQDITEAYVDLEARLKNKISGEQRLLKHLEGSKELKDTLELERELSRVRGEIEQMQGQLNLLKNRSDLATINVTLIERTDFSPPISPAFGALVSRTFQNSWQLLLNCGRALFLCVVALTPWAIVVGPIALVWLWIRRFRRSSQLANPIR